MIRFSSLFLFSIFFTSYGYPEEGPAFENSNTEAPKPAVKGKKKNKNVSSQKEAEGTEALDRFEAETVIKSRYHHNGEALEVDPD